MLSRLPVSLQQHLLLEWLSPEAVFRAAGASDAVRTCVVESPSALAFRAAADGEVLTDACVAWFRAQGRTLHLWTHIENDRHYCNGRLHRDGDLPAVTVHGEQGRQIWCQHGIIHRDGDLPAVVLSSGAQRWFQNGDVHRDGDKPATVEGDGAQTWCQNGKYHRDGDEPAIILASGTRKWCQRGQCHRDGDRPAMVLSDGF